MAVVQYDVNSTQPRNRLTCGLRFIWAIPHLILLDVWGIAAQVATFIQWVIILFTGQRNQGITDFQINYLGYQARVVSYATLMFDEYPKFGTDPSGVPMMYAMQADDTPNRLTNALRFIWAIPALLIGIVIVIGLYVVTVIQWFTILFTGKHNQGMWDFQRKALHYSFKLASYIFLTTDTYPKYE